MQMQRAAPSSGKKKFSWLAIIFFVVVPVVLFAAPWLDRPNTDYMQTCLKTFQSSYCERTAAEHDSWTASRNIRLSLSYVLTYAAFLGLGYLLVKIVRYFRATAGSLAGLAALTALAVDGLLLALLVVRAVVQDIVGLTCTGLFGVSTSCVGNLDFTILAFGFWQIVLFPILLLFSYLYWKMRAKSAK